MHASWLVVARIRGTHGSVLDVGARTRGMHARWQRLHAR